MTISSTKHYAPLAPDWQIISEITLCFKRAQPFYTKAIQHVDSYTFKRLLSKTLYNKITNTTRLIRCIPDDFSLQASGKSGVAGVGLAYVDGALLVKQHSELQVVNRVLAWETWCFEWISEKVALLKSDKLRYMLSSVAADLRLALDAFLKLRSELLTATQTE